MKTIFFILLCSMLIACGPTPQKQTRSELENTQTERVIRATAILTKYCKAPGRCFRLHLRPFIFRLIFNKRGIPKNLSQVPSMLRHLLPCLVLFVLSCSVPRVVHVYDPAKGHARFELLGMLDEYISRPLGDGPFIERFYPDEVDEADHFENLLREFCAEESLPAHWQRKKGIPGAEQKSDHITFTGLPIAEAINRNYKAFNDGFHSHSPHGKLPPAVFKSASEADLLRYVMGAYVRFGDHPSHAHPKAEYRALFRGANSPYKFELLADVLARLGCSNIRLYRTQELIPTAYILLFSPSQKVQERTGMSHEVISSEMKEWYSKIKLMRVPLH